MEELYQLGLALTKLAQQTYPQLLGLMTFISALGDEVFFLLVLPAVYWCLNKRLGRQLGYIFLLSALANSVLKNLLRQPRPFWLDPEVQLREADNYGLPSGHVQNMTAVLLLLVIWVRRVVWLLPALLFLLLMAFSRMYLGVTFIWDTAAGFFAGLIVLSLFLLWQYWFAARFANRILGRRLLIMVIVPSLLAVTYLIALLLLGEPDTAPWASFIPAAELVAHQDVVSAVGALLGFGIGMTIESSRVRLRPDGPIWKRVVRYGLGMAVALIIRAGLGSVFPAEPEWIALPLRFLRYLILLLWISLYAPWTFVRLRLASADPESEVHITFDTPLS